MFETLKEIQEVTFAEVPVMECSHSSGQVIASLEISGAEVQVYKGADQATLQVLKEPGKSTQSKSSYWTGGDAEHPIVLYDWKAKNAEEFLEGQAFCTKLFSIKGIQDLPFEEKRKQWQDRARPVLGALFSWAEEKQKVMPPKSALGKAMHYLKEQWPYLVRYLEDGRLEVSNNRAKRIIKPFVMGQKNWLFANTPAGAQASAVIYSLMETGLDPYKYLLWVLREAPRLFETDWEWAKKLTPEQRKKKL